MSMAKGKLKATKGKTGSKAPPAAKTKAKPSGAAPAAAGKAAKVPTKVEAAAPRKSIPAKPSPAAEAPVPVPAPAALTPGGVKKKNVKRGAPPMLPRRMARRPEPGTTPPSPPRLVTSPGSLHAPVREPEGAESLKQRLGTVMGLVAQLRGLKRTLNRQFFEAGLILQRLSEPALYQAKGYGSFDKFIEREIERELSIGRGLAQDLVHIVKLFQREPAEELGLERLRSALRTLWPEPGPQTAASSGPTHSG
jgi:hypothetical protein